MNSLPLVGSAACDFLVQGTTQCWQHWQPPGLGVAQDVYGVGLTHMQSLHGHLPSEAASIEPMLWSSEHFCLNYAWPSDFAPVGDAILGDRHFCYGHDWPWYPSSVSDLTVGLPQLDAIPISCCPVNSSLVSFFCTLPLALHDEFDGRLQASNDHDERYTYDLELGGRLVSELLQDPSSSLRSIMGVGERQSDVIAQPSLLHMHRLECSAGPTVGEEELHVDSRLGGSMDDAGRQHDVKTDCPWTQLKEDKPVTVVASDLVSTARIVTFNALSLGDDMDDKYNGQGLRGSGHIAFLSRMLEELQADVCAIQESRLALPDDFEQKDLTCLHVPAVKGKGGILLLIRKHPGIKVLGFKRVSPRILVAHLIIDGRRFKIVACHAPTRDSPEAQHKAFQGLLTPLLIDVPPQEFLVVCADLNARMGQLGKEYKIVGPWTSPIKGTSHVLDLLDSCQRANISFLNTIFPPVRDDLTTPDLDDEEAVNKAVSTWRKPSGIEVLEPPVYQIDYILGNSAVFEATQFCRPLPWAQLDGQHESDHRPVLLQMVVHGHNPGGHRQRRLLRKFVNETHKHDFDIDFTAAMHRAQQDEKFDNASAFMKVQLVQHIALHTLQSSRPPGQLAARNQWVTGEALDALTRMNHLRRVRAALRHKRFQQVKRMLKVFKDINGAYLSTLTLDQAIVWLTEEIIIQGKMTKACIRLCKRQWVDRQCQSVHDDLVAHDSWKAYRTIKATCGKAKRPGGFRLAMQDGSISMDEDVVDRTWLDFWLDHFKASEVTHNSFLRSELEECEQRHGGTIQVPASEVLDVLKMLKAKKATPNVLGGEIWARIHNVLASYLTDAVNMCLDAGDMPNAWRGSVVVPIRKGALSALKCASFRPIQLVTNERKVLGKLLLNRIRPELSEDVTQFCIGATAGTAFPTFALHQVLLQARAENKSTAILFLDIKAAYDCVAQELVLPSSQNDEAVIGALVQLGLADHQARSSLQYVREHPDSLLNSTLPPVLKDMLANWMKQSWSVLAREWTKERQSHISDETYLDERAGVAKILADCCSHSGYTSRTIQTWRGIKQGDSLSTWLFCALFRLVLERSLATFRGSGLYDSSFASLPVPSVKGDSSSCPDMHIRVDRLGYADDVGFPLTDHNPARLLRAVEALMLSCHDTFRSFGFELNYKRGKSSLLLRLSTQKAKGLWQHIHQCSARRVPLRTQLEDLEQNEVEHDIVMETPEAARGDLCLYIDEDIPLQLCTEYVYLGTWTTSQLDLNREVRTRRAAAIRAFNEHASILTSTAFTIHQRLALCKSLCICHLLQQLHALPCLPQKMLGQLEATYVSLLKRTCRLDLTTPCEWKALHSQEFLDAIGEPTLGDILIARRLSFLQSVMSSGNGLVQACSILKPRHSIFTAWCHGLNQVRGRSEAFQALPVATEVTFGAWVGMIVPAQNSWKTLLKRCFTRVTLTPLRKQHSATVSQVVSTRCLASPMALQRRAVENEPTEMVEELALDDIELTCQWCAKRFATTRGLASHKRTQHGHIPPLALRTHGTACPACGTQLLTRNSLLQHLANRLVCSLYVMEYIQPMDEGTYRAQVHKLDTERSMLSREVVPRTGPIPIIAGRPCSQGVEAVNPYDEDDML
eukprot:6472090-Amphidinium_carterae.1